MADEERVGKGKKGRWGDERGRVGEKRKWDGCEEEVVGAPRRRMGDDDERGKKDDVMRADGRLAWDVG